MGTIYRCPAIGTAAQEKEDKKNEDREKERERDGTREHLLYLV